MKPFAPPQRFEMEGAAQIPVQPTPKVKGKQATLPSYNTSLKPSPKSAIIRKDRGLANTDITTLRVGSDSRQVIRDFIRSSPDLSAAVTSYVRTGITSGRKAWANNPDGTVNAEATTLLHQLITMMDVQNDYTIGYDDSMSIRSLAEVWANEIMAGGAICGELVLNKARLPDKIQPIASSQVRLFPTSDGKKRVPKQTIAGTDIDLDVPTFFMIYLDEDLLNPYPVSPMETAVQGVLFSAQFMNDLRRVVRKAIHPRVDIEVDEEKFRNSLSPEIKNDQTKLEEHYDQIIADLQDMYANLEPEDAIVHFNSIGIEVKDHGNTNMSQEITVLQDLADSKLAAGAKALPVVLGKGGSSNTASTEAIMFIKYVEGAVWAKLNEMFSKIFTLAVRLFGFDVSVTFMFDPIDLKPESELEAFKAMKQSRVLALLSLGMMTDEQACIELTGKLPPAGYTSKMGTGFMPMTSTQPAGDGNNGASNSGSTLNQNLKSDAPTGVKSKNKKAEVDLTLVS